MKKVRPKKFITHLGPAKAADTCSRPTIEAAQAQPVALLHPHERNH
jgi:hypothetical protein